MTTKSKNEFKGFKVLHVEFLIYREKNPISFRKGSDSMKVFKLHRKVPAQDKGSKGNEASELIRKVSPRVKVMTMFKMTEKVKSETRKQQIHGGLIPKQGGRVLSLIRIQTEEIKRKVRECSPEAKQFIGPGDKYTTLVRRGGINQYIIS